MKKFGWMVGLVLIATAAGCGGDSANTGDGANVTKGEWPTREIKLFGPGTDSGTFDYFTEVICGEEKASRSDYTASENDNQLVTGVKNDKYALAYFGYAYYEENKDSLKLVAVDDGSGNCVKPTQDTVRSNAYSPLSRPLYIYVSKNSLGRPEFVKFVEFYLANTGALAKDVGYVPVSDEVAAENLKKFLKAVGEAKSGAAGEGIRIDGSSTVFPISEAVAEEYRREAPDVRVTVGYSGTGGGMKKFSAGEIDICDASRGIKESERKACADAGVEFIELSVAFDGLAVVVNSENDWCDCLTVEQLKRLWEPGSSVATWADLKPDAKDDDEKARDEKARDEKAGDEKASDEKASDDNASNDEAGKN